MLLTFFTLLLMISFASVNAVLCTPALPAIADFFAISISATQQTMTWFLSGYAIGQLLYGPIANRFGIKPALYLGICLQILSSLICIASNASHLYSMLVLGRFLLALGSGVGLKITFTFIYETYEPIMASKKIAYLMIAFAITPSLGVMVGGILNSHWGWESTFYASGVYGFILLLLVTRLPETNNTLDQNALNLKYLWGSYALQFKNIILLASGLLMGGATCFVYVFAAFAPFVAIEMLHMSSALYGTANLLPPIGLILGSILSAQLVKTYRPIVIISIGIFIALLGSVMMFILVLLKMSAVLILFIPMMVCYLGIALVLANASLLAMSQISNKAQSSAVMNFINMGFATLVVLGLGLFSVRLLLMPVIFIIICCLMFVLCKLIQSISRGADVSTVRPKPDKTVIDKLNVDFIKENIK